MSSSRKSKWHFSLSESDLQAQLAKCQAQVEHWQGVATICELSKQEELAELQKQCDQEIQSLQEALRGVCRCVFLDRSSRPHAGFSCSQYRLLKLPVCLTNTVGAYYVWNHANSNLRNIF